MHGYYVHCANRDCGIDGPWDLGESGAIEKWNTRAAPNSVTVTQTAENVTGTMIGAMLDTD